MIPVPPHLAGLPVLDGREVYAIRPCSRSRANYAPVTTVDELWKVLTDAQRRDLLQISLMLTENETDSYTVAHRLGAFTLYEDNEIRMDVPPDMRHQLDLARYNVL